MLNLGTHVPVAGLVEHVTAGRAVTRYPRGENVLVADRTGVSPACFAASMRKPGGHAHLTLVTVRVVATAPHAAKPTACTVELLLGHIVVQPTDGAEVGRPKGEAAAVTGGCGQLSQITAGTLHRLNRLPICRHTHQGINHLELLKSDADVGFNGEKE